MFGPITPLLIAEVLTGISLGMLTLSAAVIGLADLTARLAGHE